MIKPLHRAFEALIQSGELGKTDVQNIYALLPELNNEGLIAKDQVIALLFAGSKNADGAYRNFLSRVQAAAVQAAEAAEEQGNGPLAAIFQSIKVNRIGKSSTSPGAVQFSAEVPKELPQVTGRANRDYLPEEYLPGTGCKPEEMNKLRQRELRQRQEQAAEKKTLCCLLEGGRKELYEGEEYIPAKGELKRVCTAGERHLRAADEEQISTREALADMLDWQKDDKSCLYALLGDYGMGKTFTCRMFAQRLAERCQKEPSLPKPVYLDLRDVPTFVTVNGVTRQPTLEEMLETVLRLNGQAEAYTAKELIEAAQQGKLLCIFDGLDEKLVFYTADMQSQFLNELLRVFPQDRSIHLDLRNMPVFIATNKKSDPRQPIIEEMLDTALLLNGLKDVYTGKELVEAAQQNKLFCVLNGFEEMLAHYPADMRGQFRNKLLRIFPQDKFNYKIKIIISCRSHHFETLRQMDSFLLGLNRSGLRGSDYRALHLLPFSREQMLALLTKLLGSDEAKQIFTFIDSKAYLKDIAQRPFLLRQLSRLLPKLCERKERGKPLNAAGFYQALIEDCLSRDEEKNLIKSRHKQLLLSDLAAKFWRHSTQLWKIDQLNDWFCAWLYKRPELAAQYSGLDGLALEKDLRTSTLLVRFGEQDFGFSHSSMQEYFLSKWLLQQWQEKRELWLEQPLSELTRQFLFDQIVLLNEQELNRLNRGLAVTLARPWSSTSELALEIIETLAKQGRTLPQLGVIDMQETDLSGRYIQWLRGEKLLLDRAEAHESRWIDCQFRRVEIGQGNINGSLWLNCSWQEFDAVVAGASPEDRVRHGGLRLQNEVTLANCQGSTTLPRPHILPPATGQAAEIFYPTDWRQSLSGAVYSCCFSIDGNDILSAADSKTLKLWDIAGICSQTFRGHKQWVNNCCFSPDGKHILSASWDNTLKLWELDGDCIATFQGHEKGGISCCFSPDGRHILSASWDNSLKLWDIRGRCISTFQSHEREVMNCCFSPDGNHILSASFDKTLKLWDMQGRCVQTFQGHKSRGWSCCFSPDGSRVLSSSDDMTLKLWDLEGRCIQTFQGHKSGVMNCCFSPVGNRILSASEDGTLRLWNLDGTVERISAAWNEQWYTAFFHNNQLEKIIGTEMSWKMAHFAKDGKTWTTLDKTGCFEWVPAQY